MNFIEVPTSVGKNVIFVIVDQSTKYGLLSLTHPVTTVFVAKAFFEMIFKLHGAPVVILSDRGSKFLSQYWMELFELSGIKL